MAAFRAECAYQDRTGLFDIEAPDRRPAVCADFARAGICPLHADLRSRFGRECLYHDQRDIVCGLGWGRLPCLDLAAVQSQGLTGSLSIPFLSSPASQAVFVKPVIFYWRLDRLLLKKAAGGASL